MIILKDLQKNESFSNSAFAYFQSRLMDLFIYDPKDKTQYEIQETLRVYVERNGRPYNYIKDH